MAKKILFIVGSLRARSFNRQLAQKAAELLRGKAEVSFLDWADVPLFNQDEEVPVPSPVARVRKEVREADGIWFFSPEYNKTLPGTLKNLLDWLSRPLVPGDFSSGTAIAGKTVTVSGVGTGYAADAESFQTDVLTLTEENIARLASQATEFLAAV